ncbi:hypothetical protein Pfo_011480 [Paulownia fortunei]|nr:hypothetical protein Pfo_011480 [Paulownia fortunei]
MKKSKDPFEIAFEEQEESPPESPVGLDENDPQTSAGPSMIVSGDLDMNASGLATDPSTSAAVSMSVGTAGTIGKNKEDDEEEEEENMDVELGKLRSSGDPAKTAKMQEILAHFTEQQMSRYESFRRSGFQKSNMKRVGITSLLYTMPNHQAHPTPISQREKKKKGIICFRCSATQWFKLLTSITGSAKISVPMTIVVSGIAKMFVGELVETARVVMAERRDTGPIRPCHMREAYRRLKLDGKIPKRSVPRLFR